MVCTQCTNDKALQKQIPISSLDKWRISDGHSYPYRPQLYKALLLSDSLRTLNKDELIAALGQPDRINKQYLYYQISQSRLGFWPLKTSSLVFKMDENTNQVEWIKVHGE